MSKSINIITLGCSKNLVDSEKIMGNLGNGDHIVTHESSDPSDIVIINTCGFINDARAESVETILHFVNAKNRGEVEKLIVTGCLSQRYKYELKEEIPEIDAFFGVDDYTQLLKYIDNGNAGMSDTERVVTTPGHYAYLKIAEGCDRKCSFCAIPLIRGRYRSRSIENIVSEAEMLAGKGVKELLLIAQDISYYGIDIAGKSLLPQLLDNLANIDGIEWIRLHYAYPLDFPDEVTERIASNHKICRYLDIPLQHINSNILKSMRRGVDKTATLAFLKRLRERVPEIALRTTLMVGYPGETDNEFDELLEFVKNARFERLGVFTYSPEENTPAYRFGNSLPINVKQKRADIIMEEQQRISLQLNRQKIGKVYKVIIDGKEGEYFTGRTESDSPEIDNEVFITGHENRLVPGMFCNVRIHNASEFEIFGTITPC